MVKGGGFIIPKIYVDRHELSVDKNALKILMDTRAKYFGLRG